MHIVRQELTNAKVMFRWAMEQGVIRPEQELRRKISTRKGFICETPFENSRMADAA